MENAGITGLHRSHERRSTIQKIERLIAGDPDAHFGLEGMSGRDAEEILAAMAFFTGCPADLSDVDCDDFIDPDLTMAGIMAAAERLARAAASGERLLVATGHPTGVLEHHIRVVDAFVSTGGKLLRLREDERLPIGSHGRSREVRYVGGVGVLADWGQLLHTHKPDAMEALLEAGDWPDLVLADHGFAGAAIQRGIETIAIMDINDHALAVAGRERDGVLIVPMDDNRLPASYEPSWRLFQAVISGTTP
ncbi:MAG TPA: phosphatase [Actinomycetota bacterium]|nr:phosphatase [Actinomycetota bacterium]